MVLAEGRAAEQSVIGGCLLDNDAYWRIADMLKESDFSSADHRRYWRAICASAAAGDPFDAVTLSESHGLDLAELMMLANEVPGASNITAYARLVRDKATLKLATTACTRAAARLTVGDLDALNDLRVDLDRLNRAERPTPAFYEVMESGMNAIEAAREAARAHSGMVGAPTGIHHFDRRTRGLSGGKLIILAARPALGKTAFALQAAQAAAAAGFPTGIISLEMAEDEVAVRVLAHQYQLNNTLLSAGENEHVERMLRAFQDNQARLQALKELPLYIDADCFTLNGIIGRLTEWHHKYGLKLAIIDHLQLVELPQAQNRNEGLGMITRQLKILSKRLDIPIVLLCQLNRAVEREKRRPKLADLRDSGNIEQDADIVAMLHGDVDVDSFGMRDVEIGFPKMRGGVPGWPGTLKFNGPTQTFKRGADYSLGGQ